MSGVNQNGSGLSANILLFIGILLAVLIALQITGISSFLVDTLTSYTLAPEEYLTEIASLLNIVIGFIAALSMYLRYKALNRSRPSDAFADHLDDSSNLERTNGLYDERDIELRTNRVNTQEANGDSMDADNGYSE